MKNLLFIVVLALSVVSCGKKDENLGEEIPPENLGEELVPLVTPETTPENLGEETRPETTQKELPAKIIQEELPPETVEKLVKRLSNLKVTIPIETSSDVKLRVSYIEEKRLASFSIEPESQAFILKAPFNGVVNIRRDRVKITADDIALTLLVDKQSQILVHSGEQVRKNQILGTVLNVVSFFIEYENKRVPICFDLKKIKDKVINGEEPFHTCQ